jgi:MarR family transcriptional regulator, transcriptional regulator for hemolysin
MDLDVLSTPGHLISLAARGFARLSEARLKPLGFGVGHLPVLVALQDGRASTQRDLARFARIEQPPMAQMLARMERDGLIEQFYSGVIMRCCEASQTRRSGCSSPC